MGKEQEAAFLIFALIEMPAFLFIYAAMPHLCYGM